MLSNLQNEIELLQKQMECKSQLIRTLFIDLVDIQYLFNSNIAVLNCFETLRVEIIEQIFDYLDLNNILNFRLTNKLGNQMILIILQRKVNYLKINKDKTVLEIENLKKDNIGLFELPEINQLIQQHQKSVDALNNVYLSDICELKAFNKPHQLFIKIFELLGILLNGKQPQSWRNSLQIVSNPGQFMRSLIQYNVSSITDKQLIQLQQVYEINERQVFNAKIIDTYYKFIKSVVQLRESQQFHILHKIYQQEGLSQTFDKQILRFQKIIK